jgi:diguanylate cyclase (GGDEF)-like protein
VKNDQPSTPPESTAGEVPNAFRTAGDLCRESVFVEADISNKKVFDLFDASPELLNIPVVEDGEVVGLINRDSFMRSMARRFHWELYANKRCSKMMDTAALTVDADTPISDLADLLLGDRHSYRLSDGFVIKKGKKLLGTGLTSDVLAALLFLQRLLAEQLVKANEKLQELSITDPLTGLHNRRHFKEVLAQELKRARRNRILVGMIMLDLDYFKKLNDRLGHQAGDAALCQVAGALSACLRRPSDYCFRIGGEEFAVLIVDSTPETTLALAEILRGAVENRRLDHPDNPVGFVTISAGVALSHAGTDTPDTLYARADEALYEAKRTGRNRVVVAENAG